MKQLLIILVLATVSFGQGRIDLPTAEAANVSWISQSYLWDNAPNGGPTYYDHVQRWTFNGQEGTKQIPGEVQFGLNHESKWYTDTRWQSEFYWNWSSANGLINIRPFGFDIDHDDGSTRFQFQGELWFVRNVGHGSSLWGKWFDTGRLDLSSAEDGGLTFKNNHISALCFKNAANNNCIGVLSVNTSDQVEVAPGGQMVKMNSFTDGHAIYSGAQINRPGNDLSLQYTGGGAVTVQGSNSTNVIRMTNGSISIGGNQVVGQRCAAIPNSTGTAEDNQRAVNAVLACMRFHGLAAP